jgi:hypothetical protein
MTSAVNENAIAFLNQIESIKSTDVSPERLHEFVSEEDFNGVTVELLIEVGSYLCVAANLFTGTTRRWNRNQAILGGHLVRLYKLISALLDQICQHRREITFIIARLAFECIVNLRYLIKFADDPAVFDSYVAYSLRQEKRLHDKIGNNISAGGGKELPVHTRMLNSIAKAVKASGARIEDLSPSRPRNWADKNLFERAQAVGLNESYIGTFGGPSLSVHGNWGDLLEFQLDTNHEDGTFKPSFDWRNPRPQIATGVAFLAVEAARDYFNLIGDVPLAFLDEKFGALSDRIRQAAQAHESFLIKSRAL